MKMSLHVIVTMLTIVTALSGQWKVDRSHTMINFTVPYMMISEVSGTFKEFDGTIVSAKDDFTDARINISIKAKSIDTGNNGRDNHLRGSDFFNADVDSIITFVSSSVEKTGNDTYAIRGILTMRGVSKEVVLSTHYKGKIAARGRNNAAFKATAAINRKEWGLNWNRNIEAGGILVGETVELTILAQFVEQKS